MGVADVREITEIIVHCADTQLGEDDHVNAAVIDQWHRDRGWDGVGYHHVITRSGAIEPGRIHKTVGAHAYGHNEQSIGVCLVGGYGGAVDYLIPQWASLRLLLLGLATMYSAARVIGHNDVTSEKTCPNFNVRNWWNHVRDLP